MKKISLAINVIPDIKTAIVNKINALSSITYQSSEKVAIKTWYETQLNLLSSALSSFRNPPETGYYFARATLTEVIVTGLSYVQQSLDTDKNIWNVADPSGILDTIKNYTVDDIWIGATSSGQHPVIQSAVNTINSEKAQMNNNFEAFRAEIAGIHFDNILEVILESRLPTPPQGREEFPSTQECATIMYMDWDIKDFISDTNMTIYIPTYVR